MPAAPDEAPTSFQSTHSTRGVKVLLGFAAFAVLVFAAMTNLWRYESTLGAVSQPPTTWPVGSRIEPDAQHSTLLLFLHPQCPCSRASLEELAKVLDKSKGKVDAYILMALPEGVGDDWRDTPLWRDAANIPGVQVRADVDAKETRRFVAQTSGLVLLYFSSGELGFAGGITGLRGHVGDNAGASELTRLISAGHGDMTTGPVFGCALTDATE